MPFGSAVANLLPVIVVAPIAVAAVLVAISPYAPRVLTDIVSTATAAGMAGLAAVVAANTEGSRGRVVTWLAGWKPSHDRSSVGLVLVADRMSAGLAVLIAVLMALAMLFGWKYFDDIGGHFHPLMLMFLAGMEGFALSGDIFDMFVFFELMGAAAYALTGSKTEDPSSLQGSLNFGVLNSLGAYFSLSGIGVLYAVTGNLQLPLLAKSVDQHGLSALVILAFVFILCGFLVKAAMVPFHFWLADAHAVAPTPVCVLFSGAMVELGVYGVARVYWVVFEGAVPQHAVRGAFVVLGTLTAIVGSVMSCSQRHIKRLLAYSTVAHVGLFLVAFAMLDDGGTAGLAVYVLGHAGAKSALFLLAGIVLNRFGSVDEVELYGRGKGARVLPWLWVVGGLALAACPPFGTGLGKDIAEAATLKAGYAWLPALFVLVSAVTAGAVLRVALRVYFGLGDPPTELSQPESTSGSEEEPEVGGTLAKVPLTMLTPIVVLLGGTLALGVAPGFAEGVGKAAHQFIDRTGYITQAVANTPSAPVPYVPEMHWTTLGVGLGLASAALSVALAFAALYAQRFPAAVRRGAVALGVPLRGVRRVHSGHVGDYVAWLFVGLVLLAGLVGVPVR